MIQHQTPVPKNPFRYFLDLSVNGLVFLLVNFVLDRFFPGADFTTIVGRYSLLIGLLVLLSIAWEIIWARHIKEYKSPTLRQKAEVVAGILIMYLSLSFLRGVGLREVLVYGSLVVPFTVSAFVLRGVAGRASALAEDWYWKLVRRSFLSTRDALAISLLVVSSNILSVILRSSFGPEAVPSPYWISAVLLSFVAIALLWIVVAIRRFGASSSVRIRRLASYVNASPYICILFAIWLLASGLVFGY